jgi:hypothetical protein
MIEAELASVGDEARAFLQGLLRAPVKPSVHIRRILGFVRLYGRAEVLEALGKAAGYQTYDAAYVESLIFQARRRRQIPSPTPVRPRRMELVDSIDIDPPDPAVYDRIFRLHDEEENR